MSAQWTKQLTVPMASAELGGHWTVAVLTVDLGGQCWTANSADSFQLFIAELGGQFITLKFAEVQVSRSGQSSRINIRDSEVSNTFIKVYVL